MGKNFSTQLVKAPQAKLWLLAGLLAGWPAGDKISSVIFAGVDKLLLLLCCCCCNKRQQQHAKDCKIQSRGLILQQQQQQQQHFFLFLCLVGTSSETQHRKMWIFSKDQICQIRRHIIPTSRIPQNLFFQDDQLQNLFLHFVLKFIYSEKATKFCKIFTLLLSYVVPVKCKVKIS